MPRRNRGRAAGLRVQAACPTPHRAGQHGFQRTTPSDKPCCGALRVPNFERTAALSSSFWRHRPGHRPPAWGGRPRFGHLAWCRHGRDHRSSYACSFAYADRSRAHHPVLGYQSCRGCSGSAALLRPCAARSFMRLGRSCPKATMRQDWLRLRPITPSGSSPPSRRGLFSSLRPAPRRPTRRGTPSRIDRVLA